MVVFLNHVLVDLALVTCSERLHQQSPLGVWCVKIIGSGGIWLHAPLYIWPLGFSRVLWRFAICCHHGTCLLSSMVKWETQNVIPAEVWHLVIGRSSHQGDDEFSWWFFTCSSGLGKWGWQYMISTESQLSGWKSRSSLKLVVSGNDLVEGMVNRACTYSRVRTYDLGSGNNDACVLFPYWRSRLWIIYTSGVVLVEIVVQLHGIGSMPLGHCVFANADCNWYFCDINICSL
jgi:hypothetical protein